MPPRSLRQVAPLGFLVLAGCADVPGGLSEARPDADGAVGTTAARPEGGRYRPASGSGRVLQGFHPEQGLDVEFGSEGATATPRDGARGRGVPVRLGLRAFQVDDKGPQPGAVAPALAACAAVDGVAPRRICRSRVQYSRPGLTEWWEDRPDGLDHGFTFDPPEGAARATFDLSVRGATPVIQAGSRAAVLDVAGGTDLRYAGLRAWDALGRDLPARMESIAGGIRLAVDIAGAVGEVTVDPLLAVAAWTATGERAGAALGYSVAPAGDVNGDGYGDVIAGAYADSDGESGEGTVYLFLGTPAGLSATPAWTAESDEPGAWSGYSVASAGDVNGDGFSDVVVGAPAYESPLGAVGRVMVYHGGEDGLPEEADWTQDGTQVGGFFGGSVASAGDVNGDGFADLVVGARGMDNGQPDEGMAYVYLGSPMGLSPTAVWSRDGGTAGAAYGHAVSSAGDADGDGYGDLLVGAPGSSFPSPGEGRAYLYLGNPSGLASVAVWVRDGDQAGAAFGSSVAAAGDVDGDGYGDAVVGADGFTGGESSEGRAALYRGGASGLSATPDWTFEGDQAGAGAGASVASAGDVNGDGYADVVVGAPGYADGEAGEGRAWVFLGSAGGLGAAPSASVEPDQAGAGLGICVAGAGDVDGDGVGEVLIGAAGYDSGLADAGAVFLHAGETSSLDDAPAWTGTVGVAGNSFSLSAASAGDVNGDGYDDLVLGSAEYSNGEDNEGWAGVYLGAPEGFGAAPAWEVEGDDANSYLGKSVSGAGDVNGDGYADVVVGQDHGGDRVSGGRVLVFHGSASGLPSTPSWTATGDDYAQLGADVDSAGDVNGDGYGDVVVGATFSSPFGVGPGKAYVYLGSASGLETSPVWEASSGLTESWYGLGVAGAGDVNGDGYADVLVAAFGEDGDLPDQGAAYLYLGSPSGPESTPSWSVRGEGQGDILGLSMGSVGDVNGDGFGDVGVGVPRHSNGQSDEGRIDVHFGSPDGLSPAPDYTFESDEGGADLGYSVSGAGDVDGDGYGDIIAGAPFADGAESAVGRVYLILGAADGPAAAPDWTAEGDADHATMGLPVAGGMDANGDGYGDVAAGMYLEGVGPDKDGWIRAWLGNGADGTGPGLPLRPEARTPDGLAPIAPGLTSSSPSSFMAAMHSARLPVGVARARLQVEVKPMGTPFDGSGLAATGPFTSTGLGGIDLSETVAALEPGRGHHWRARVQRDPTQGGPVLWGPWVYGGVPGDPAGGHFFTSGPAAAWYEDGDGDGYGDPATAVLARGVPPDGRIADGSDCDDGDPEVNPGVAEVTCDGVDTDCSGSPAVSEQDQDGDGLAPCVGDCNDQSAAVYEGAMELCDDLDNDCDGEVGPEEMDGDGDGWTECGGDCDDADADFSPDAPEICDGADQDCDGVGDDVSDADLDGHTVCEGDCDDANRFARPGALERCNGFDDDCDGGVDEGFDPDGDGFTCGESWDCDPRDPAVHPGAAEVCNGLDDDCDFVADEGLVQVTWYLDADGDGHGDPTVSETLCEVGPPGYVLLSNDCDDTEPLAWIGAPETCDDGVDNDCDGDRDGCALEGDVGVASADAILVGEDPNDNAGYAVAPLDDLDGDGYADVVVSAPGDDGAGADSGAVYVFYGPVSGEIDLSLADAKIVGEASGDKAGWSVAGGSDTDGDGYLDLLVGAPQHDAGGADAGAAYLVRGPFLGAMSLSTAAAKLVGEDAGDKAGAAVALMDVTGDGVADAVVGAAFDDDRGTDAGAAYVVDGPLGGTVDLSTATGKLQGPDAGDQAGYSVAVVGDVDGDGVTDLAVGSPQDELGGTASGTAYIVRGPVTGRRSLGVVALARLVGEEASDQAGRSVAGAGDQDGDGLADVLVGAYQHDSIASNAGAAYVVLAPFSGTIDLSVADAKRTGALATDLAGILVAGAGDVDGDGVPDLLVGANQSDAGGSNAGAVYLLYGPVSGVATLSTADARFVGEAASDQLGYADGGSGAAAAGDVDGDGCTDVLVSARLADRGGSNAGAAYVVLGTCF
ncbi:FG-GAP-like repeat-containing protein [Myxococcota bacterium]|nr:FG-GAP-like repeat-containing protein [Myxococcota bacterium]